MATTKLDMNTTDWTKAKYAGFKPITQTGRNIGTTIVLKDYLEKVGLSQRSLAELCDLSQPAINDLCENRMTQVNLTFLARICEVLDIPLHELMIVEENGAAKAY